MQGLLKKVPKILVDSDGTPYHYKDSVQDTLHRFSFKTENNVSVLLRPAYIERDFSKLNRIQAKGKIIQQGRNECAIASMAMFLERPVEDVKESFLKFGWDVEVGATFAQQKKVLRDFGFNSMLHEICPDDACIFGLPSLNVKGKSHSVLWTGEELLDPQTNNPNVRWYGPDWGPLAVGGFTFLTKSKIFSSKG